MRAYCTDPVCAPARSSWMTGRYSSETGVPHNRGVLHDDLPDLGAHLNAHGFPAYHAGKWHIAGRDVTESFRTLYVGKRRIGAGGGEYYDGATTRSVVEFLTGCGRREPFFLQIGMVNPHDVCEYGHDFEETPIPDPVAAGNPERRRAAAAAGELPVRRAGNHDPPRGAPRRRLPHPLADPAPYAPAGRSCSGAPWRGTCTASWRRWTRRSAWCWPRWRPRASPTTP